MITVQDIGVRIVTGSENRVIRGGNFNNNAQNCRSANRNRNNPDNRNNNLGFRPAARRPPAGHALRTVSQRM